MHCGPVVDYVDIDIAVLGRMFDRRLRTYRSLGYEEDAPLPFTPDAEGADARRV